MTGGHVWAPTCHPHSECHKALLFQGSGCTQLVLMVSPKAHRLTLSPKLYVCKESFIGTPFLTPYCPQACTQLQPGGHGYSCSFSAKCGGVPWPLHFLSSARNFGLWVLDSPSRGLALLPSLSSSSTGHTKKSFLPAEHGCPLRRNAWCPATIPPILVYTHRSAIQHQYWMFCVLGLCFMTPQRWFCRNIWSWI